jgi:uncharacterized protein (TIGR03382 family)
MRATAGSLILALAGSAAAQSVTLTVTGLPTEPVPNGAVVAAYVRPSWSADGGIGYAGGAFRVRFDGLSVADVTLPNENPNERVGINGAVTIWSSGRRPPTLDGTTGNVDGTFRQPPQGNSRLVYSVESQRGATYLTGRMFGIERQIEHAQFPPALMPVDTSLFVSDASFDLFKFTIRAPLAGRGTVTITPEMISASIFIDANGAQVATTADQRTMIAASFTYTPGPPAVGPLALAAAGAALRRRRRNSGHRL